MSAKTLGTQRRAGIGLLALALAACGGGGGGDSTAPAARGGTPLALSAKEKADQSASVIGSGEAMLQVGQLAADYAGRFLDPGTPLSASETCPNGGIATVTLNDVDGNQVASAGDTVIVDWQDCGLPLINEVFSGTFAIEISSASRGRTAGLAATVQLGRGATVLGTPVGVTVQLLGSLGVSWTRTDFRTTLEVTSTAADDLRIEARGNGITMTEAYKALRLRKELRFDEARSVVTLAMHCESDSLGGSVDLSTPQPLLAYLNRYPETGRIEIRGAGAAVLVATPNFVDRNEAYTASLDADGDGITESSDLVAWQTATMGYFWWDSASALPWFSPTYTTFNFASTNFEVAGRFSDVPGGDDSFRIQFTRPPVNPPALQYRFRDAGSTAAYDGIVDNIAATAERQGALIVLRPERALRHARSYSVELSTDGQNWNTVATFRDALANSLLIGPFQFGFNTTDNLRALATINGGLLASATATVQLDASASRSASRPIVAYAWRQLSGTPLQMDTPQAATSTVRWGPTPPTGVENAVIELTVTDAAGDTDTTRAKVNLLNPTTTGRVLYFRSSPGDYVGAGQTVLVGDGTGTFSGNPANTGYVNYTYSAAAPDFGTWWNLTLTSAGQPLRVGAYENAVRAPFAGNQNGIDFGGSGRGCGTIFGRFDVLEIATDAAGTITRLAVDFEQHCESASAPPLFGSLRVDSTVPIRP